MHGFIGGAAALAVSFALIAPHGPAVADRGHDTVPLPPSYVQECGSCHVAYPPSMLPAASWQRLMGSLERHFGADASLDPAAAQPLAAWLAARAGTTRRANTAPPEDRITRSRWFVREHDEIAPSVWQRPAVKSAANCSACHPGAEQGDFDDDRVRIPR